MTTLNLFVVPGVVSNFLAEIQFTSVVFNWGPVVPEERNGIIIAYELTYTVNGSNIMMVNFTDVNNITFTVTRKLDINTNVSDISVRAYTSAGPGNAATTSNILIPATPAIRELDSCDKPYNVHIFVFQLLCEVLR